MQPSKTNMIKIQRGKKIFAVKKPENLEELEKVLKKKFRLDSMKDLQMVYEDSNKDEIFIETDEDLLTAFEFVEENLKIVMKQETVEQTNQDFISSEHLLVYENFLKKNLP